MPVLTNHITLDRYDHGSDVNGPNISYKGEICIIEYLEETDKAGKTIKKLISSVLLKNHGKIIKISNLAGGTSGKKIKVLYHLVTTYKNKKTGEEWPQKDWGKEAGVGFTLTRGRDSFVELHWYRHPNVGIVEIKVKWDHSIKPIEERVEMGKIENKESGWLSPPKGWVKPTKENFFKRVTVVKGDSFKTMDGIAIKSIALISILKDLREFMLKNDINGFYRCANNNIEGSTLSSKEKQQLNLTVMTNGGVTVLRLVSDIVDMDEE